MAVPMADARLVLFTRLPVAGQCKTRLIPALGPDGAAKVHKSLTERTLAALMQGSGRVEVHYTGGDEAAMRGWLGDGPDLVAQADGDLGARLLAAMRGDAAPFAPVLFFGSDTPDLTADHVQQAMAALASHDVVIGPAEDGGYYLIGMRRPMPQLFTDMPWSSPDLMAATMAVLAAQGIAPHLLERLSDCDTPEDLARWPWLAPMA